MTTIFSDITTLQIDAIVNAANSSLLGGGGVDGAVHRAAGHELVHECQLLGGCKPGQAKITKGYNLPAKYIIHTVGPVWRGGDFQEEEILSSCYRGALELCNEYHVRSVAFPCIATGIYGFPRELAARVAVNTCRDFLTQSSQNLELTFCCYGREDYELYQSLLRR